jgi:ribose 5-phosphate isomerase B
MRVHLGSDHGAIELRQALAAAVREWGHELVSELGPSDASESVDYPDIAAQLAASVLADRGSLGVLACGTGQGMAMAANKISGIRAAVVLDGYSARMAREHNDANVLCLGGRVAGVELAKLLLQTFLAGEFAGGRHARRVAKIEGGGG